MRAFWLGVDCDICTGSQKGPCGPAARSTPGERHRTLIAAIEAADPAQAREQFTIHAQATADLFLPFVQ